MWNIGEDEDGEECIIDLSDRRIYFLVKKQCFQNK
jgi:hypothetical protein